MGALYLREVKRFQKILLDTVCTPVVSMMLFLLVFGMVAGDRLVLGVPYSVFVYTGLLAMTLINASFSNPAFAFVIGKNLGTNVDLQVVPISPFKIGLAYAAAALTRGALTIVFASLITVWFLPAFTVHHTGLLLVSISMIGLQFGLLGVVFGMRAKSFESLTFMTTFIMQPMIFLAGTFYPITQLPGIWQTVAQFNPLHHSVNILRYSVLGIADGSIGISFAVVGILTLVLLGLSQVMTKKYLHN